MGTAFCNAFWQTHIRPNWNTKFTNGKCFQLMECEIISRIGIWNGLILLSFASEFQITEETGEYGGLFLLPFVCESIFHNDPNFFDMVCMSRVRSIYDNNLPGNIIFIVPILSFVSLFSCIKFPWPVPKIFSIYSKKLRLQSLNPNFEQTQNGSLRRILDISFYSVIPKNK